MSDNTETTANTPNAQDAKEQGLPNLSEMSDEALARVITDQFEKLIANIERGGLDHLLQDE